MTYEHIINCILFEAHNHSVVLSLTHRHIFQPFAIIKQLKFRIKDEQINVYLRQIWAGARCVASNGEHLFSELQIWYIWDVAQLITIYRWLSLIIICIYGVCTWTSFLYDVAKHAAHIIFNCGIAGNRLYADSRANTTVFLLDQLPFFIGHTSHSLIFLLWFIRIAWAFWILWVLLFYHLPSFHLLYLSTRSIQPPSPFSSSGPNNVLMAFRLYYINIHTKHKVRGKVPVVMWTWISTARKGSIITSKIQDMLPIICSRRCPPARNSTRWKFACTLK